MGKYCQKGLIIKPPGNPMPFGGFCILGGDSIATENFKRKLTTILSADVENYSRLMDKDEDATVRSQDTHRGEMISLIKLLN